MELPIGTDPNVLEHIYQHFTYLRDHPLELRGAFVSECVSLGVLHEGDFLSLLQAHPVQRNQRLSDRVPFLSKEQNLEMDCYRLVHIAQPWPKPLLSVAFTTATEGVVMGMQGVDVDLHRIGSAQLWWGGNIGLLFEATFNDNTLEHHDLLLHQVWEGLESYLKTQGVKELFTYAFDPDYSREYYSSFLTQRGYAPYGELAAVKTL